MSKHRDDILEKMPEFPLEKEKKPKQQLASISTLQHRLRHVLHGLPNAQVAQDLLRAT